MSLWLVITTVYAVYAASNRPNFIFILTDDMDFLFDSISVMPNTLSFIGKNGLTFNNAFVSTPVCCPSRTETISGRNFQNIRYPPQDATCMYVAARWNSLNNTNSLFQLFHSNGYITAMFGKMTNDQQNYWCNNNPQMNGFDRLNVPCAEQFYQLKWFNRYLNGTYKINNYNLTQDTYLTSIEGNETIKFLNEVTTNPTYKDKPFLLWLGPHAPHVPAAPAAWYANKFNHNNSIAPRTPNFNVKVYEHHDYVSTNPVLNTTAINWIDQLWRDRLRSLLSVDDIVGAMKDFFMKNEQNQAILNNTYIVFTSDHGFHLGQWRLACTKKEPYDTDIRVPLLMSGPGIKKDIVNNRDIVLNIDIVPTFLDLAGIKYDPNTFDGKTWVGNVIGIGDQINDVPLRENMLTQYMSIGTYLDFSWCPTWWPNKDGSVFPGQNLHPPCCNENGEAWMIDDTTTNNWRALRIINNSVNYMYSEFVLGINWNETVLENPYFYEFYDLTDDQYQINNLYSSLSKVTQYELHQMLMNYGSCEGTNCW
eukprot:45793_1